jgi:isoleucyl-tRNA synthetase
LGAGAYEERADGVVIAAGEELAADEVVRTERVILEGWAMSAEGGVTVAFDPTLDDELIREGEALELIRALNEQRKREGLELTDRIELRLPAEHAEVVDHHRDWIAAEVLATAIEIDAAVSEPVLAKTEAG